jgi:ABC-2 type transport system ATP-binding protein
MPSITTSVLRAEKLCKTFEVGVRRKRVDAVIDLDFSVERGEIFGFVGPNGAGKTTTIKMLMGLIFPTSGSARIFDAPIPSMDAKRRIGYLPEHPVFQDFLTGREAVRLFAVLSEVPSATVEGRVAELLELVGLTEAADRQIRKYSKGMQQRIGIAQALAGDPAFLVLDEPMSGLDPIGRKEVRDLILDLNRRGKTVFFSTHILPDVESICHRVGVILRGRLRDVGRISDLLSPRVRSVEAVLEVPEGSAEAISGGRVVSRDRGRVALTFPTLEEANASVAAVLAAGGSVVSLVPHRETLEDFFMRRLEEDPLGAEPPGAREAG